MDENAIIQTIGDALAWMPNWLLGLALMTFAAGVALLLHGAFYRLLRRLIGPNHIFLQSLTARIRGPLRLALIIFALSITLPSLPFSSETVGAIGQILLIAFILLVGWVCMTAVNLGADLYLRRFRIDVEDNLLARKHVTQMRILRRTINIVIGAFTIAAALMTMESVRNYGISLFASAGAAGLVVGLAARPVLSNLIAGLQIATAQPIRIDDAVVVEGEWGWIEEITATYVVIRIWDWRRLIVPLSYFIEQPFQNWTRENAAIIGTVFLYVDYRLPVEKLRQKLSEIVQETPLWDKRVVNLQVVETTERTMQLRALVSARNSPEAWDLRCFVREKLIDYLQREFPDALPRQRAELEGELPPLTRTNEAPFPPRRRPEETKPDR